jgi:hypothetical protein
MEQHKSSYEINIGKFPIKLIMRIEFRTNANQVAGHVNKVNKQLEKAMPKILRKIALSTKRELRKNASRFAFKGDLLRGIRNGRFSKRRATIVIEGIAATEAMLAEYGPTGSLIGHKRVYYMGSSSMPPKLRAWAQSKGIGPRGVLKVGGATYKNRTGRTAWGTPSHRFMSAERRTRPYRAKRIMRKELKNIKGIKVL